MPALFFPTVGAEEASSKNDRCHRFEMIQPESSEPLLEEVLTEVSCWSKYESSKHTLIVVVLMLLIKKYFSIFFVICIFNPLTPLLPILDKPWPLFHFVHQFWPTLASSILDFRRTKRSFQWYLDQSYWLNGAWNMHENAQKFGWKTQSKIAYHCMWQLRSKYCLSRWWWWFCNFNFCACATKQVVEYTISGKKAMLSCCKWLFE